MKIERLRKDSAYLARHEDHIPDVTMNLLVPSGDFLIVVDTNIFLSHLRFLNRLSKSNIASKSHLFVENKHTLNVFQTKSRMLQLINPMFWSYHG
jgi:hypothetical protein